MAVEIAFGGGASAETLTDGAVQAAALRAALQASAARRRAEARRRRWTRIPPTLAAMIVSGAIALPTTTGSGDVVRPVAPAALARASGPGSVQVLNLPEPHNGTLHSVWVYRPKVADSARLPVVYFLHGIPGQAHEIFRIGLAASLDRYFAAGHQPFVVAAPNGHDARADTEWADATDGSQHLESFVVNTVITAVEGANRRDRAHRAITGFSMGGYGATNIALHHPDLFGQLVSLAGYYHASDPNHVFGRKHAVAVWNSPARQLSRARGLRMLLMDANHDQLGGVRGQTQRFARLLREHGLPYTMQIARGGHDWAFVARSLPALESFLDAGWPRAS